MRSPWLNRFEIEGLVIKAPERSYSKLNPSRVQASFGITHYSYSPREGKKAPRRLAQRPYFLAFGEHAEKILAMGLERSDAVLVEGYIVAWRPRSLLLAAVSVTRGVPRRASGGRRKQNPEEFELEETALSA